MKQYNIEEIKETFKNDPIPNRWGGMCFGCSKNNDKGLQLDFYVYGKDFSNLNCVSKTKIPGQYVGFDNIAHGGIITTLLDEVSAWTIGINNVTFGFTVTATINFLRPVPAKTEVYLIGEIMDRKGDKYYIETQLLDATGTTLAFMESKWKIATPALISKITGADEEKLIKRIDKVTSYVEDYKEILRKRDL